MKVQELMSKPVVTCRQHDSLNTAAGKMWDRNCGAMPVVDATGCVVGVITDRDICMAAYTKGKRLTDIRVSDIASGKVFSVKPTDSVQGAEQVMRRHQVRRIPVVDDGDRVVGILSLNDIAREGARESSQRKKEIGSDEVLQTLAAICQPNAQSAPARRPR